MRYFVKIDENNKVRNLIKVDIDNSTSYSLCDNYTKLGYVECTEEEMSSYEQTLETQLKELKPSLTPEEQRELNYHTVKCITYDNKFLTVDEANDLWLKYSAENNEKAIELSSLIAEVKTSVREQYPDVVS